MEYISADTPAEAVIAAGYSEKGAAQQGHRLLKNASVVAEIQRRQEELSKRTDLTEDNIIKMLLQDHDDARKAGAWSAAVKAVELMGKKYGMWRDNLEIKRSDDSEYHQAYATLALSGAHGDRVLARQLLHGFLKQLGGRGFEDPDNPRFSSGDIEALLDGAVRH